MPFLHFLCILLQTNLKTKILNLCEKYIWRSHYHCTLSWKNPNTSQIQTWLIYLFCGNWYLKKIHYNMRVILLCKKKHEDYIVVNVLHIIAVQWVSLCQTEPLAAIDAGWAAWASPAGYSGSCGMKGFSL